MVGVPKENATGVIRDPVNCARARATTSPPRIRRTEKTSPGLLHCELNSLEGSAASKLRRRAWMKTGGIA